MPILILTYQIPQFRKKKLLLQSSFHQRTNQLIKPLTNRNANRLSNAIAIYYLSFDARNSNGNLFSLHQTLNLRKRKLPIFRSQFFAVLEEGMLGESSRRKPANHESNIKRSEKRSSSRLIKKNIHP